MSGKGKIMKRAGTSSVALFLLFGLWGLSGAQERSMQYCQAGHTYYSQKNYDQAIRYYDAALNVDPNLWQAYQGLGNCHYAKGDKPKALSNYLKCLSLHRENPSLSSFVESLRAEMKEAESAQKEKYSGVEVEKIFRTASGASGAHFELNPSIGVALPMGLGGLGLGGGGGGFYMFDPEFGMGGMVHIYLFGSSTTSTSTYTTAYFTQGTETATSSLNITSLEVVPAIKYKLAGKVVSPYLVAGFGLTLFSAGATTSYAYSNGPPYSSYGSGSNYSYSRSAIFPILVGGCGVEVSLGEDVSLFAEARFDVVIGSGATSTYIPVEAGLSFKL
jgi:hypothetical protein